MGKNTIAQVALGKSPEDEFKDNLHFLSPVSLLQHLICNISMTNMDGIVSISPTADPKTDHLLESPSF